MCTLHNSIFFVLFSEEEFRVDILPLKCECMQRIYDQIKECSGKSFRKAKIQRNCEAHATMLHWNVIQRE